MIDALIDKRAAVNGLTTVTRIKARTGLDGLLARLLVPPRTGLIMTEVAAQAPDMAGRADTVAAAGGLALLMDGMFAWNADVASALVLAACQHWPDVEPRQDRLRLAIHEALVNAVLHGCLRIAPALRDTPNGWLEHVEMTQAALEDPARAGLPVLVTMETDPDTWTVRIEDRGPGFKAPAETDMVAPEPGFVAARGRGILLMRAVCDRVAWSEGGRVTLLTVRRADSPDRR